MKLSRCLAFVAPWFTGFFTFGLGGSDSNSPTNSTSNYTTNTRNLNLQDAGGAAPTIAGNEGATINVLDTGAVTKSLDIAKESTANAIDAANRANDAAFNFASGNAGSLNQAYNAALNTAFSFARDSLGLVQSQAKDTVNSANTALNAALNQTANAQSGGAQNLLYLAYAAVAGFVLFAWMKK